VSFGYDRLSGVQRRVRSVAFVGPLDTGQPAAVAPIATAGGVSTDTAIEVLGFFTDGGANWWSVALLCGPSQAFRRGLPWNPDG